MKRLVGTLAAVVIGSAMAASSATAGPATDGLAACLADSTTGKERKDMARWVFVGMSAHPDMQSLSNVTEKNRDELDRMIAAMLTKLMTESCPAQAKLAMEKEGSAAFQAAFSSIGRLAMQELMSNPAVNASFSRYTKYIDEKKFSSAFPKK